MGFVRGLVVSVDQLLNTICGGDPDITISARVGYFSNHMKWKARPKKLKKWFWEKIEKLIDWAYEPVDGPSHCLDAYKEDPDEPYYISNNGRAFLIIMSLIIISICIVVGGILHLLRELRFIRSDERNAFQTKYTVKVKEKIRVNKGIKKILWTIVALIIILICAVITALILIPIYIMLDVCLIFLIIMALILVPVSILLGVILYFLKKLGFIRFNEENALQSRSNINVKVKNRLNKRIKKILWIIVALIIIPICTVITALILIPIFITLVIGLIFLIVMALILVPVSILLGVILFFLKRLGFIRFNEENALQDRSKISVKIMNRLEKGINKFQNVLNEFCKEGINLSDRAIIIMDMLCEIFGYHRYSEITSDYDIKKTSCVLTVKINKKPEFLIMVYPDLKTVHNIQLTEYGPNQGVDRVILTNGINWKVFKINNEQAPNELVCEFNFLSLNPKKSSDVDLLYYLSKESLGKSATENYRQQNLNLL